MMRRTLLAILVSAAVAPVYASTIEVNTFVDEDGENSAACSLREAIKASAKKMAYGGCIAGERFYTDIIQLEKGTYTLTKGEIEIASTLNITGASAFDINADDVVTGRDPARLAVSSTIQASTGARIFNTSSTRNNFLLTNLVLNGGSADKGGAIRAGGSVTMNRVTIQNAVATNQGGAIYLEGSESSLTSNDSLIKDNLAPQAAAIGMSCLDSLVRTARSISLVRSSVIHNGNTNSLSVIDVCGEPTFSISDSTISQNTVQQASGAGVVRLVDDGTNLRLGGAAVVGLTSVTMVENSGRSALTFDNEASVTVQNSILAFNQGLSCEYVGTTPLAETKKSTFYYSLLGGTKATASTDPYLSTECHVRNQVAGSGTETNIGQGAKFFADVLYPLSEYGGFLPTYLPKMGSVIVDKGVAISQCGDSDQRGVSRSSGFKSGELNTSEEPRCDIGAVELSRLTANDDSDSSNVSYDKVVTAEVTTLTDEERKKLSEENQTYLNNLEKENEEFIANYKANFSFRRVFVSVLDNDIPLEVYQNSNGASGTQFKHFGVGVFANTGYTVTTKSLGTGPDIVGASLSTAPEAANSNLIHCAWIPSMRQVAIWRDENSGGYVTPSGDFERCVYTIKYQDGTTSQGVAQTRIVNIAPIAKDDDYTIKYGEKQISLNILANDSDDGDGPVGAKFTPSDRTVFYSNPLAPNSTVNIRIVTAPTLGKLVFERQGSCPDNSPTRPETTCYGGKMTYVSDNLYSKFNDSFTYQVLDADKTSSNTATVTITNTATTTDDSKAGGGAVGLGAAIGLLAMAWARRRMRAD